MRAANGQLSKLAVTALYKRKDLESNDIHAIARNGKVTLVGMTASQEQIDLAGKIVEEVPGVISITNNLTVEEPGN
jgi:osmotically-inducible protein OsmY